MIHIRYRRPNIAAVTVLANIRCLYVQGAFASRISTVVTTAAVVHDIGVVEVRRHPGYGGVTVVAGITAGNMRRVLASRYDAIVAGTAGTDDLRMIDRIYRNPDV